VQGWSRRRQTGTGDSGAEKKRTRLRKKKVT